MPLDHSPVKTRGSAKVGGRGDKAATQRTLSDSSLSGSDNIQENILTAVQAAFNNDTIVSKIVDLVAAKVSQSVNDNLKSSLKEALAEVDALKAQVSALKEKLEKTEEGFCRRMDELEQYQRRNNLRVFGVEEKENENTDELILDICRNKLGVNVSVSDIDRSHRVGKVQPPGSNGVVRPRPIIVKFVSYRTRRDVFSNKRKLKGCPVNIKEDLTPHRLQLFRNAVSIHGVRNVWTIDGRVNWTSADNRRGWATWTL